MDEYQATGTEQMDEQDMDGAETPRLGSQTASQLDDRQAQHQNRSSISSTASDTKQTFFLYTKLNQNQTKSLKKAGTNAGERRVLAEIFNLKSIVNLTPNESPSKVELLKLDFHYMNYVFCKKHQYSNEKVSTMLAILDFVFNRMLEKQLKPELGLKLLKDLLSNHSIQRPPYQIFIFTDDEVADIIQFSLVTFLRHFSLYEFAFKPRVELVLRSDPVFNTRFNAPLQGLDEMQEVEDEEAANMKAFLKQLNLEPPNKHQSQMGIDSAQEVGDMINKGALEQQVHQSADGLPGLKGTSHLNINEEDGATRKRPSQSSIPPMSAEEKKRVGKVYDKDHPLDQVVAAEMARIRQAFDRKVVDHTEELVTKVQKGEPLVQKGPDTTAGKKK